MSAMSSMRKQFSLASREDAQELKNWCRFHWADTLSKAMRNCNSPIYHDCCLSFSKKGFAKKSGHPELQSASVLKIPSLRSASSPEDMYEWVRERMLIHHRLGKTPVFPTINTVHISSQEDETDTEEEEQREYLGKRCQELAHQQREALEKITQLAEDNKKLQASSKSWCLKYQELLLTQDKDEYSFTEGTPRKPRKQGEENNESFLLL